MTEGGTRRLYEAVRVLFARMPGELMIAALWEGDPATVETTLTRDELLGLISASALGTGTRYVVGGCDGSPDASS